MAIKTPLFSIIIPLYNREQLIKETLLSVKQQTYNQWECIIVDDGSTDNSREAVLEFEQFDTRFRFIERDRVPKGAPTCRNIGAKIARGDYLIFLDSDDLLIPEALERRKAFFDTHPKVDFIVFPSGIFQNKIGDTSKVWNRLQKEAPSDFFRFFNRDTPWCITGPTWRVDGFHKVGGFKEKYFSGDDWALHVKAILKRLHYQKSTDDNFYLDNYIRRINDDPTKTSFYSYKQMSDRLLLYEDTIKPLNIARLNSQEYKVVIAWIFRYAMLAKEFRFNDLSKRAISLLKKKLPFTLYSLLFLRTTEIIIISRIIDSLLYRFYGFEDILNPIKK